MPLTTIETEMVNNSSPIHNQYSLGNKLQSLASGFIPTTGAPDSEEVGIMSNGSYRLSTISSGIHRIATADIAIGARITAVNQTSGTTSYFLASSGGTWSLNATGGNVAILEPGDVLDIYKNNATEWLQINATGDITGMQLNT